MNCSVAQALDVVGDPWTLLIVRDVLWGHRRFSAFHRRLGIPRNTLTVRLDQLVKAGILERTLYQTAPERYEYVITDKGIALRPIIVALMTWGDEWSGTADPPVVLVDRETGAPLDPIYVDRHSGRLLDDITIQAVGDAVGDQDHTA